jgi:hypothetical protein
MTTLIIKLPDFCRSCHITVRAYVENNSIGRHDIVLGTCFIKQLVLILDFTRCAVTWNDVAFPMQQNGSICSEELSPVDIQDIAAPEILQHSTRRMECSVSSNKYHQRNDQAMIIKCIHLSNTQQDTLLVLFN